MLLNDQKFKRLTADQLTEQEFKLGSDALIADEELLAWLIQRLGFAALVGSGFLQKVESGWQLTQLGIEQITGLATALSSKQNILNISAIGTQLLAAASADQGRTVLGALSQSDLDGYVRKVNGVIATSDLPLATLVNTTVVASQAEMLALNFQRGDYCWRSDVAGEGGFGGAYFDLVGDDPKVLGNWVQRQQSMLRSINRQFGPDVMLAARDVGADPAGSADAILDSLETHQENTSNPHRVTAAQVGAEPAGAVDRVAAELRALLDGKQPLDGDLSAIANLVTTAFGRSFLTQTDAASARGLIGTDIAGTANTVITQHEQTVNHPLVSAAAKGMMSADDFLKLAGIAPGATANATNAALRDRRTHREIEGGAVIYASDFGVKADLVHRELTYNTVERVSGTDTTTELQNALNAAGAMVPSDVNLPYEGCVRVVTPAGKIIVSKTLIIPPNVILDSRHSKFYNFLSNDWLPIILGSRHSHATIIEVHANKKSGIWWGDPNGGGVRCDSFIDAVRVQHAGVEYESTLPPKQQKCGLRLFGLWYTIGAIEIKEANLGLDLYQASDVLCPSVFVMGSSTAIRCESAEQIIFPCVALDTNISTGIQIDNSNNIHMMVHGFVNSDGYGTPMQEFIRVGFWSGIPCRNVHLIGVAISCGGRMLNLSNCQDCTFKLVASNARLFSQTSGGGTAFSHWNPVQTDPNRGALWPHDMGMNYQPPGNEGTPFALIRYGSGITGNLDIDLWKPATAITSEGTVYGRLVVNGVLPWAFVGSKPTTLAGYGITDALTANQAAASFQPLDSDLSEIASLSTQPYGRSLLTVADAAAARTALGITAGATRTRSTVTLTTDALAVGAIGNYLVALGRTFRLIRVEANANCRVRVYSSAAYRTADTARAIGVEPALNVGLISEVIFGGAASYDLDGTVGSSTENPASDSIPIAVTNLTSASATITLNFTFLRLED